MINQSKIKILYLITKSNWGGAQRYVYDLASNLDSEIYDVAVILGGAGQLKAELEAAHIRVISLSSLVRDISLLKELKSLVALSKILRAEKPDIFHINSSKAGGLGAFLGRLLGIPRIIFTAHGWVFNEERPLWQRLIIKALHWITVLFSHTTIVVSETTKRQLNWPFVQNKMTVIHNGRTASNLHEREKSRQRLCDLVPQLRDYRDDFWSVTIGELHPVKQHEVTIRALAQVVRTQPKVRHIIIGEGSERAALEQQIIDTGLEKNVFLIGNIFEAAQYLKAFDLFVLSSRSEALAYVIIEACIAGLPIIASNVGGIPEIITHEKNGLLFTQGDVNTLGGLYSKVYEDSTLRDFLAQNAHLRAQDFTLEKMLLETTGLYANSPMRSRAT